MMRGGGIIDMAEDGALENDAVLPALAYEPWEINGGVDTHRCEGVTVVNPRCQLALGQLLEL